MMKIKIILLLSILGSTLARIDPAEVKPETVMTVSTILELVSGKS
jgi:hypothetical protein